MHTLKALAEKLPMIINYNILCDSRRHELGLETNISAVIDSSFKKCDW